VEELHRRLGDELPIAFVFLAAGHPGFPISKFAGNEFVPVDLETIASALGDGAAPENAAAGPLPGGRQG